MYVEQSRALEPVERVNTPVYWNEYPGPVYRDYTNCVPHAPERGTQYTRSWRTGRAFQPPELAGEDLARNIGSEYRARYDTGHEFFTRKDYIVDSHPTVAIRQVNSTGSGSHYTGHMSLRVLNTGSFPTTDVSTGDLQGFGRQAIAQTVPTAPEASLAAFLGEIKERLPQLIGFQTFRNGISPQTMGGEYLNYEFGVMPTVKDIETLTFNLISAHKLIDQMKRDSGRPVRRGLTLQEGQTHQDLGRISGAFYNLQMGVLPGYGSLTTAFTDGGYSVSSSDLISTKIWFSGAYTYHLAEAHDFLGKMTQYEQLANRLLGTRITLDTVWQLTPWSWLLDWFTDLGTFFKNVTLLSSDSTVLRYGYVMHETRAIRTHVAAGIRPASGQTSTVPSRVTADYISHVKRRIKATPYGFDSNLGNLSPRRWAILGALGLTKVPGQFR